MVIREPHTQIMLHTPMHKAVTGRVEAKKLLSRPRQPDLRDVKHVKRFLFFLLILKIFDVKLEA